MLLLLVVRKEEERHFRNVSIQFHENGPAFSKLRERRRVSIYYGQIFFSKGSGLEYGQMFGTLSYGESVEIRSGV
jgi:hypothetical protein